MKAYKITSRNLKSLTVGNSPGGVQYGLNQVTIPKTSHGPLAAFKCLENVRLFKHLQGWGEAPVFECEVERDRKAKSLWYYTYQKEELKLLPEGTILCKKITLIKEVK